MSTLEDDPLVALLRAADMAVTRENWISLNYGREVPDPWTSDEESEVPEELQDWSKVKIEDRPDETPEEDQEEEA